MSKYDGLVHDIIENIGGKSNVISLTHCVTRLRFKLKDEKKANDEIIKALDGVITLMHSAGQYQIVIGNNVGDVFDVLCKELDLDSNKQQESNVMPKMTVKEKFIDLITSIFMPSISILCACGMIKGLNSVLQFAGLYTGDSGIFILLNSIGDCVFFFFPIVIGYNSAIKFKLNSYVGMMIGAALCYPAINGVDLSLFGITMNVTYTSTVIPVILTVAIAAPMERFLNRIIPDMIKSFFTPMIVLLVSTILGFMIIGPISNVFSTSISNMLLNVYDLSPILAGILIGGLWQIMVVFGIHMTLVILAIMNIANGMPDPILSLSVFAAFAQSAVVLAILLKTKNQKLKALCVPAFISGMFGVTEAAIYGITLPRIKLFVVSCIGSALAGGYAGFVGLKYHQMAGLGIFEIPALFPATGVSKVIIQCIIASLIAFAISFILAVIIHKDEPSEIEVFEDISMPIKGEIKKLTDVKDAAFSSGTLGHGLAIIPSEGMVYAPFDGTVLTLFPSKHAIGLVSNQGCELLIHIGMDTVQLDGKYFEAHIKQGDIVKKGQLLVSFDIDKIKEEGFSLDTCIIITNSKDYTNVNVVEKNHSIFLTAIQ